MRRESLLLFAVIFSFVPNFVFGATQACSPISLTPVVVPDGNFPSAVAYQTATIMAAPGLAYEFTVTDGVLPAGLVLSGASGAQVEISGAPTQIGSFLFTVTATDPSNGCSGGRTYVIDVFECGNGVHDPGEQCDDGNLVDGDGCSLTCIEASCYGIVSSDPTVCSGFGACVALDTCQCSADHFGDRCDITTCFGAQSDDIAVCSGFGTCVAPDTCQCVADHFGDRCELFTCFGRESGDPTVCSGFGQCVEADSCQCVAGHTGVECQIPPP